MSVRTAIRRLVGASLRRTRQSVRDAWLLSRRDCLQRVGSYEDTEIDIPPAYAHLVAGIADGPVWGKPDYRCTSPTGCGPNCRYLHYAPLALTTAQQPSTMQ